MLVLVWLRVRYLMDAASCDLGRGMGAGAGAKTPPTRASQSLGRTRVNGVCVARTTIRQTRRAVRRGYRRGYY
jgi:hypothetical protein